MITRRHFSVSAAALPLLMSRRVTAATSDPLGPWRSGVTVKPVTMEPERHTIHTYYLTCPESPDGSRVLFFRSAEPSGERGELVVQDRATGKQTVIATDIDCEDAHRAACQQWVSGGKRVAFHDVKDGRWFVRVVDLDTMTVRTLAEDRQLCFGRAVDDLVPIYGCHWNPGAHRHLELLDVATGQITTVLKIEDVEAEHGEYLRKTFGDRPTSIFFPNISPDGQRVFFKMAAPGPDGPKNNFRSKRASDRQGLFVYELGSKRSLFMHTKWGHPAWGSDSKKIIEIGNLYFDLTQGGKVVRMPDLPKLGGAHPSFGPGDTLFVTDGQLPGESDWGVAVCDARGKEHVMLRRFNNSGGAKTWRKNHPHPIFSRDGRRVYFNVNAGAWTQLFVAECAAGL